MRDTTAEQELSTSLHISQALAPRDNSRTRISGIGGCRRQIAYRRLWHQEGREEPAQGSHLLSVFEFGHAVHLKLQHRLSNAGPLKWVDADPIVDEHGNFGWAGNCEIGLRSDEHELEGHLDALTRPLKRVSRFIEVDPQTPGSCVDLIVPTSEDDPEGRRYIIDIKTITARDRVTTDAEGQTVVKPSAFEKLKAPKDEHIQQVSMYCYLTTQPGFQTDRISGPLKELPAIMIIYVAKDLDPNYYEKKPGEYAEGRGLLNSPYKIFTLDADPRIIQALLTKNRLISEAIREGRLPARDFHHTPARPAYACVDCPFRHTCYAEEGYFAGDLPTVPARLHHHLGRVDHEQRVLG